MWRIPLTCVMLVSLCLVVASLSDAEAQRRVYGGRLNIQQLVRRIEQLERRVAVLERGQPRQNQPAVLMSVEEAERHVAAADERHAFSEKLYSKGYISETEFEADKFELARALQVLQLSEATRDGKPTEEIAGKIETLEAEHNLAVAKRRLLFAGTDAHRRAVDEAQVRLDEAKARQ